MGLRGARWEFPKIGDPNIVPQIVGSLLEGPQNKVLLIFGNSQIFRSCWGSGLGVTGFRVWVHALGFRVSGLGFRGLGV